ncbi:MAG: hypothetical protein M3373_03560 [Gemmatimonadota bacterium]|nr:hypothetical protein [Gemmatimonadota bacterium]
MRSSTAGTREIVTLITAVALAAAPSAAAAQGAPAKTKVEEQVLITGEPGMNYLISPAGQHLAAVVNRGSRLVVVHDGIDGPRFDAILPTPPHTATQPRVVFSPDASRYAYLARQGQEYVYMVDGKELLRVPVATHDEMQFMSGGSAYPEFTPNGRHVYFMLLREEVPGRGTGYHEYRVYWDGKPGPVSAYPGPALIISPDGLRISNHRIPLVTTTDGYTTWWVAHRRRRTCRELAARQASR